MLRNQHYFETIPPSSLSKKTWDITTTVITAASGTVLLGSVITKGAFGAIISAIIGVGIGIVAYWSHNRKL